MLYLAHNSFEKLSLLCSGGFFVYIQKSLTIFAEFPAESLRIFCIKQHPLQKIPQRAFKSLLVLMSFNHPDAGGLASLIAKSERSVFRCNGLLIFDVLSNRLRVIQKLPWIPGGCQLEILSLRITPFLCFRCTAQQTAKSLFKACLNQARKKYHFLQIHALRVLY